MTYSNEIRINQAISMLQAYDNYKCGESLEKLEQSVSQTAAQGKKIESELKIHTEYQEQIKTLREQIGIEQEKIKKEKERQDGGYQGDPAQIETKDIENALSLIKNEGLQSSKMAEQ